MAKRKIAPILKWAGGKKRLIDQLRAYFPHEFPKRYVEPFVGGGALLFWMLENLEYFGIDEVLANDKNVDLIQMYQTVKLNVDALIEQLEELQAEIRKASDSEEYYLLRREEYNDDSCTDTLRRSALMIFLNRTCFNGLYRVNSKGKFNVPYGKKQFVNIFDPEVLRADSEAFGCVTFTHEGYQEAIFRDGDFNDVFYYFDPPYRPLTPTSSFASYTKDAFGEKEQIALARHCKMLHEEFHAWWMLSNSYTKDARPDDDFYERNFEDEGFHVKVVTAPRMINAKASKRGAIKEVLIMNYEKEP